MSTADAPPYPRLRLLPGRDRRVLSGHPWVFANELKLDAAARALPPGCLVTLCDAAGRAFATATFNVHSLIAVRIMAAAPDVAIDTAFLVERLQAALALRRRFLAAPFYRLVHAEADRLPGIVIDRYGDVMAVQSNTAGAERLRPAVLAALQAVVAPRAVVRRDDAPVRQLEGLPATVELTAGRLDGPVAVDENGSRFLADLLGGQKTGWFYDLRRPRGEVAALAGGGRLLDLYCHTGGFAVQAARAGARAVAVDRSAAALALAAEAARLNGVAASVHTVQADAFAFLADQAAAGERFAVVVADPPSFVKARKDLPAGLRAYRKLARLAAALVAPGGLLFIASCSHHVAPEAFAAEVAAGLTAARRGARILLAGGAGPDHPVHPLLPESAYLKWQVLQLD